MALLNIGASNKDDAFYRYKMPRLMIKTESSGNGIKTNIMNMADVAKALARPPEYTVHYFGCELGAGTTFNEKTGSAIVKGQHDYDKLAGLLEKFIKKYVQCYGCGNPETEIIEGKKGSIALNCAACGFISNVDMRDKLATTIAKHNLVSKKSSKDKKLLRRGERERIQEGKLADEEQEKAKKRDQTKKEGDKSKSSKKVSSDDEKKKGSKKASSSDEDEDDDVQWQADTSAEAARQRIKEQLTGFTTEMIMKPANDKVKKKLEVKETEAPKLITLHNKLVKEFKEQIARGLSAVEMATIVKATCGENPSQEVAVAYFQALFDGVTKELLVSVKKRKAHLAALVGDEEWQELLLVAIEVFCSAGVEVGKQVPVVLKFLYDADLVDEEHIVGWYKSKPSPLVSHTTVIVRKYTEPLIRWLEEAESEDDD